MFLHRSWWNLVFLTEISKVQNFSLKCHQMSWRDYMTRHQDINPFYSHQVTSLSYVVIARCVRFYTNMWIRFVIQACSGINYMNIIIPDDILSARSKQCSQIDDIPAMRVTQRSVTGVAIWLQYWIFGLFPGVQLSPAPTDCWWGSNRGADFGLNNEICDHCVQCGDSIENE